jgi:hypothetical protein
MGLKSMTFIAPGFFDNNTVGVSYVVTKFATAPDSLLVYYMITDKSASARIPL